MKMAKIRPLSPDLQQKAEDELHEVSSRVDADIAHIRDWLIKQPHIHANPDDQTIVTFLRGCKFNMDKTKGKLDMYYTMHTAVPEFFKNRNVNTNKIRELLELQVMFPLPEPDEHGRRIFIIRPGLHDPSKFNVQEFAKLIYMSTDVLLRDDDNMVVGGLVNIIDCKGVSMGLVKQFTPIIAKKTIICSQESFPLRPKGNNYIYTPSIVNAAMSLIKSLAKDKFRKRFHAHGNSLPSLYKQIPQCLLPEEYGGSAGTIKEINDAWIKKMESYNDWFIANENCGVDEKKRPGKQKTQYDLFGFAGSFNQLITSIKTKFSF